MNAVHPALRASSRLYSPELRLDYRLVQKWSPRDELRNSSKRKILMKRLVLNGFAVLILAAAGFFQGHANAGNLPGDSVKVIPRVSNPVPPPSRPASNPTRYEGRSTDEGRVQSHTSETRNGTDSGLTTRQRTEGASGAGDRHEDGVCTSGNPKLLGVHCSASSQCSWGARCVGQPARCANTGTPCVSSAQCMVQGVCSSGGLSSVSNHRGGTSARPVPVSRDRVANRTPTTVSGGRGVNPVVPSR